MKSLQMYRNLFANIIKIRKSGRFFSNMAGQGWNIAGNLITFAQLKRRMSMNLKALLEPVGNLRVVAFDVRHRTGVSDHGGRVLLFRQPVQHRSRRRVRHGHRPAQRLSLDSGRYVRLYDRRSAAGERHHRFRPAVRRPHALRRLPHAGSDKPALVDRLSQPGGARSARSQAALRRCDRPVERPDARGRCWEPCSSVWEWGWCCAIRLRQAVRTSSPCICKNSPR